MKLQLLLLSSLLLLQWPLRGQHHISRQTYKAVLKLPDSVAINQGSLTLYNLFKVQVIAAYENRHKSKEAFKKAVLETTYYPYESFWAGYVGNSDVYFNDVLLPLLHDSLQMIENKARLFARGKIDVFFKQMTDRMKAECGYYPQGKWYFAFGHAVSMRALRCI